MLCIQVDTLKLLCMISTYLRAVDACTHLRDVYTSADFRDVYISVDFRDVYASAYLLVWCVCMHSLARLYKYSLVRCIYKY